MLNKKKCILCNKEFIPIHYNQIICKDKHFANCAICNNVIELKKYNISKYRKGLPLTCSKKCATKLMEQTNLKKYGNICSAQNVEIHRNIINKYNEKYGGDSPFCSKKIQKQSLEKRFNKSNEEKDLIKQKVKETNLKKYGNENYNNPEKFKSTMQKRYGVNYTNESNNLKLKQQNTMYKRYQVKCSFSKGKIRDKIDRIIYKKYGTTAFVSSEKTIETNLKKYGVPYYVMTEECRKLAHTPISQNNIKFKKVLDNLGLQTSIEFPLENLQYDIKVEPDILIEIDPTFTHNSTIGPLFTEDTKKYYKDKFYHKHKTEVAKENGYKCIHVFDWDDKEKIINLLKPKQIIYARKLKIKEVSNEDCAEFLNKYHLQNTCRGQNIRLGLYLENQLIQLMTFGKPRYNKNYEYELLRLCTNFNYRIIGGSEKIFKYFIKIYDPKSIISYCDLSKFEGNVYKKLGFKLNNISNPSCRWSKGKNMITNSLLMQRGYDQLFHTNYGKGTSNRDLMIQSGWREVYDCRSSFIYLELNKSYPFIVLKILNSPSVIK